MARPPSPDARRRLLERAARMLAAREPISLRALVDGTGMSTMAVYTQFGGMPGLWQAVRQEGFRRLADRLAGVTPTDDPVADLATLGAAYLAHAAAEPDLYRVMFDASADLEDPTVADAAFGALVAAATRAREIGRLAVDVTAEGVALRIWAAGHGLALLVIGGVLPRDQLDEQGLRLVRDLVVGAGDDPGAADASVRRGWAPVAG